MSKDAVARAIGNACNATEMPRTRGAPTLLVQTLRIPNKKNFFTSRNLELVRARSDDSQDFTCSGRVVDREQPVTELFDERFCGSHELKTQGDLQRAEVPTAESRKIDGGATRLTQDDRAFPIFHARTKSLECAVKELTCSYRSCGSALSPNKSSWRGSGSARPMIRVSNPLERKTCMRSATAPGDPTNDVLATSARKRP